MNNEAEVDEIIKARSDHLIMDYYTYRDKHHISENTMQRS